MTWIDSHAHLGDKRFADDLADVLARALEAGVEEVINIGTQLEDSHSLIELARATTDGPRMWSTIGVHPHHAKDWTAQSADLLRRLSAEVEVVGLGEIGLDYHYDFSPRDVQHAVFSEQLRLADELDLPIVIHCREAMEDTLALLDAHSRSPYRGVFHCFAGDEAEAQDVLARGFHISFTGPVTFKKADDTRRAARAVPLDRLLVETDCPYLAPVPKRGKRNEPSYVVHTARKLAELHGVDEAEFAAQSVANTRALFSRMTQAR